MGKITKHVYDAGDREGWLALRSSMDDRLGGSEVGAAANHSKYSSFLQLLNEKVGVTEPEDISGKMAVKLGVWNEEFVAKEFEVRSGKKVHRENCIFTNTDYPHLKATIDRKISGEDSGLECKFMSDLTMMRFGRGEFPEAYKDQCVTYLAVTALTRWYLAICTNSRFYCFLMTRDKAEEERYYALKAKCLYPEAPIAADDADLKEWESKYAYVDAVYYLDEAEMQGAELIAAHFIDCVASVMSYMAQYDAEAAGKVERGEISADAAAADRKSHLVNAVYQVVDPADIDNGGESTEEALHELSPVAVPDSVVEVNPESEVGQELASLLDERAALNTTIKDAKTRVDQIDNDIALRIKDAETTLLPTWKITYKNGAARCTASADAVEAYFESKSLAVPEGMIKVSEGKRSLRVYARSEKSKKPCKAKAA